MKKSALQALRQNTPQRNAWLAMLGPCVDVPHGARMAALVALCSRVRETQPPIPRQDGRQRRIVQQFNRRRERMAKARVATQLAALLFDALAELDPQPLENLAAIVRRIRQHNADGQPALVLHDKALRLAEVAWLAGKPLTAGELIRKLGGNPELHDEASTYRKAAKFAKRFLAPDKRGAPKKGTRNRRT